MTKKVDQEKKLKDPKGDFPEAHKEVNHIYGGPDSYEQKRKQKLTAWEVMAVSPTTPEYLKWSEVPITFDRSDLLDFIPKSSQYPLMISPIAKDVKLNRALLDGGSSRNIMFMKTFDQMGLSKSTLLPSWAPFHRIVPGVAATPVGQITLPVTIRTWENLRTEYMQFKVANFEMTYNAFLGRLALTKFMATPHYAYLVLKRPGPNGIITIKADVKHTYIYDRESCDTSDRIIVSTELQELNKALPGSPTPAPDPYHTRGQVIQDIHPPGGVTQQDDPTIPGWAL
jgi:hypothetical protein